nr:hypothetical protein [Granulosicoccus sp.]
HWRKTNSTGSRLTLLNTVDDMQDSLQSYQMQLIEDMQGYPLVPLLMRSEGRQALLFFSIKRKANNCLWFDLMHCSDFELFAQNAQQLANQLLSEDTAVLAADGRFIPESCRRGLVAEKLPVSRYFMSQRVAAHEIDHLYSELQLLDLKLD